MKEKIKEKIKNIAQKAQDTFEDLVIVFFCALFVGSMNKNCSNAMQKVSGSNQEVQAEPKAQSIIKTINQKTR